MRSQQEVKYGMMFVQILKQSLEKEQPFRLFPMVSNSYSSIEQNLQKQSRAVIQNHGITIISKPHLRQNERKAVPWQENNQIQ